MNNVISTHLSDADRKKVDELITQLETLLEGKLAALTEAQRQQYGVINEQNKLLVNKVYDYAQHSPQLRAPEVDWDEFMRDYQSRQFIESRKDRLSRLVFQLESTKILHDYDNYHDALTDYSYAQYKKGAGGSGYTEKVSDLRQFFPRNTSAKSDKPGE